MTTTTVPVNNVENSVFPSSLYNIQYPNCSRGMFSLREPFKDMETGILPTEQRQPSIRHLTPAPVQRIVSENKEKPIESKPHREKSKRNAHVQCSLLTPNIHHDMAVQTKIDRQRTPVNNYVYDDYDYDINPRHQKIYEIWDVDSPPLQTVPINQTIRLKEVPRARHTRHRKPIIEYPDEEEIESDYNEEHIIYARQPRKTIKKTYLPPNVRMICVRDDANRVSY